jgi:hypothetical protein
VARSLSRIDSRAKQSLTILTLIPEKMRTCSDAGSTCRSVDRSPIIQSLSLNFAEQLKELIRLSKSLPNASKQTRVAIIELIVEGYNLKALADAELAKCPRVENRCD